MARRFEARQSAQKAVLLLSVAIAIILLSAAPAPGDSVNSHSSSSNSSSSNSSSSNSSSTVTHGSTSAASNASGHQTNGTAGTSGSPTSPQPNSTADNTGHGANSGPGPYTSTRNGSPSGNGNGTGLAVGKPCAGCVGKADNKNPAGQMPNGSDRNAGYECDRNHGIGRTNPAHTGCQSPSTTGSKPRPSTPAGGAASPGTGPPSVVTPAMVLAEQITSSPPPVVELAEQLTGGVAAMRPAVVKGVVPVSSLGNPVAPAPSEVLPSTGMNTAGLVGLAVMLLIMGTVMKIGGHRRPSSH
jgi:hypothetical protein